MKINKTIALLMIGMSAISATFALSSCDTSTYKIGIIQYSTHEALNQSVEGFKEVLNNSGLVEKYRIKFNFKNPEGQASPLNTYANSLAIDSQLIYAVATPVATQVRTSVEGYGKDTPIIFGAVTDPIDATLVTNLQKPGKNISGISDQTPIKESIELLKTFKKDKMKIALLYSSSEKNSLVQVNQAIEKIEELGWEYIEKKFANPNEISTIMSSFKSTPVDAIFIPTDNQAANAIEMIRNSLEETFEENRPIVLCGDTNMLKKGAHISLGVNYLELGKLAGEMAVRIIDGKEKIGDIPVQILKVEECSLAINNTLADKWGIQIPQELLDKANMIM